MATGAMTASQVLAMYRDDVNKLANYLDWLEDRSGKSISQIYNENGVGTHSVTFPVYDSTLMSFIKECENTVFMDRNYRYVYTRNRIRSKADEEKFIERCNILQMDQLGGILSYYILGGRSKAKLWSEGMDTGVFYAVVKKAKDLVDFWTNAEVNTNEEA